MLAAKLLSAGVDLSPQGFRGDLAGKGRSDTGRGHQQQDE
jgi:hypothetical protein